MAHFIGNDRLMTHIMQFVDGRSPGGAAGMADFFVRLAVTVDHVIEALLATRMGDAAAVAAYVTEHPELQAWYAAAPPNNQT
ncbi:MAG: hypothetical protein RLZZ524_1820 [Pseudomonadota bacterium]|jgi:hypothetical protein